MTKNDGLMWPVKVCAMNAVGAFVAMHFAHRFGYVALVVVAFLAFGHFIARAEKAAK